MPYQMKNGKWRADKMICGRRRTKLFPSKREAQRWEASQNLEDWLEEERKTATISCLEWATAYLDFVQEHFVRTTYNGKALAFRLFFKSFDKDMPVEDLSPRAIIRHLGQQAKSRSGYSANKDRKNLRAAWVWGVKYLGMPEKNPFIVDRFPEVRQPRYIPPVGDLEKVLAVANGETRAFLLTALHTAARRGELFRMKWSDIDLEARTVTLYTRKRRGGTLEGDILPMTKALQEVLALHKKNTSSVFVFGGESGMIYRKRGVLMQELCEEAGVLPFGLHAMRHLAACMMDRAGVPLATIQMVLRHKSATTTSIYLHSLQGVKADLDGVFGSVSAMPLKNAL